MKSSLTLLSIVILLISQLILSSLFSSVGAVNGYELNNEMKEKFTKFEYPVNLLGSNPPTPISTPMPILKPPLPMSKITEMWVDDDYNNQSSGGHTWGVDAFDRIQAAINSAGLNFTTTINILPGDYYERITIDRPVKLIGEETGNKQLMSNISGEYGEAWALICVSANDMGTGDIYPDRDCFPAQGLQAYYTLKNRGYDDDHIILMLWHDDEPSAPAYDCEPSDDDDGVDEYISIYDGTNNWLFGPDGIFGNTDDPIIDVDNINVTKTTLQQQITNLSNLVSRNDQVLLYFVNHGRINGTPQRCHIYFEDNTSGPEGQYLDAETLDSWLDQINCKRMSVLTDMCRAGDFINSSKNFTQEANRLIIGASGDIDNIAHAWFNANSLHFAGSWFFHPFWNRIDASYSVRQAYEYALEESDLIAEGYPYPYQYPFLIDKLRDADKYSFTTYGGNLINFMNIGINGTEIKNCAIEGDLNKTSMGINMNNYYVGLEQALINDTNTTFHDVTVNSSAEDSSYFDFFSINQSVENDSFMLCGSEFFSRIFIKLSPGGVGLGGAFSVECAIDRNKWVPSIVRADTTNNLTQTGDILFIPPVEWAYQSHNHTLTRVKSDYGYWVRLRLMDKFESIPKGDYIDLMYYTEGSLNITNNRIISHDYGIYSTGIQTQMANRGIISNLQIKNNEINSNNKYGLYCWGSDRISISSNIFKSNNWSGVHLNSSTRANINNNDCSNNDYGISILIASHGKLTDNICTSNNRRGIYIGHSNNFTVTNSTCNSNTWSGIHFYDSVFNDIFNNSCSNNDYGLSLSSSNLNTVTNNTCNNNAKRGHYISHSNNNLIISNNFSFNNWSGIRLWNSNYNQIKNNFCESNNVMGIVFDCSSMNIIDNCSITLNPYEDFYLKNNSLRNIAINTSFDTIFFNDPTSELIVQNYLHITVNDTHDSPFEGVDFQVKDNILNIYLTPGFGGTSPQTNSAGELKWILVTDRIYDGSSTATENVTRVIAKYFDTVFWKNNRLVDMSTSHTEYFYPNSLPTQVLLESPGNNSNLNLSKPVFTWFPGTDNNSDPITYDIQIDDFGGNWSTLIASKHIEVNVISWFPIVPIPDGSYQWRVCANDDYGNSSWSEEWRFVIDTTEPKSNITIPKNNDFYKNVNTISGFALDPNNGTGLNKVEISIKRLSDNNYWNGLAWDPSRFWLPVVGSTNWTFDSSTVTWTSGIQYLVQSRATDAVDNVETQDSGIVFDIDKTRPVSIIDTPINNTWFRYMNNISGSSYDIDGSGIKFVEICILDPDNEINWDGVNWTLNETWLGTRGLEQWFFNTSKVNWSTDKHYSIRSRATDNVGNIELPGPEIMFMVDNKPPNISISINSGALYASSTTTILNLIAIDSGSGTHEMSLSSDNETWTAWGSFMSEKAFILSKIDGDKMVYFKVRDIVGNTAEPVSDSIILDTTPPHSLAILINNGAAETNSTVVTLTLQAIDKHSGLYQMTFSSDGKNWEPWLNYTNLTTYYLSTGNTEKIIYFKVKDRIGNIADPAFAVILLNITTPPANDTTKRDGEPSDDSVGNLLFGSLIIIIIVIILIIVTMIWLKKRKTSAHQEIQDIEDTEE